MDFDIETISHVLPLIFKIDEHIDERLVKCAQAKTALQKTIDSRDEFTSDEEYNDEVVDLMERRERIKQSLVDSNLVMKKEVDNIIIKGGALTNE